MSLKDSGEVPGILSPLGQLCAPKEGEHEEALAFALGGGMNSIVFEMTRLQHLASSGCATTVRVVQHSFH